MNVKATLSRRELLRLSALGLIAMQVGGCNTQPPAAPANTPPATPTVPEPEPTPPPTPTPSVTPDPMHGRPWITPNAEFYVQSYAGTVRDVDLDAFRLVFDGEFENPFELTLEEIKALPAVEDMRTLECIGNPVGGNLIGNAVWTGTPLKPLLERARPRPRVRELVLRALDGYHTSLPLRALMDDAVLLVYAMNGEPLPRAHGFPLRISVPGRYGQKQPKWLTRIEAITGTHKGHYESRGWSNEAFIKVNSQIDVPENHALLKGDEVVIRGIAFAGLSGIARVEVSTDDGHTWHEAHLRRGPSTRVWVHWAFPWKLTQKGLRTNLWARASDNAGQVQQRGRLRLLGGTFPDGTSDMHSISVQISREG